MTEKQAPAAASRPAFPLARRGREILRILYWCGISNAAVLAAVAWSFEYRPFMALVDAFVPSENAARRDDPPPSVFTAVAPGERKITLPLTVIARSETAPAAPVAEELVLSDMGDEETSFAAPDEIAGGTAPVLRRNPATGGLEIGNFKALSFAGSTGECLALGRSMITEAGAAPGALEVLADSGPIAAARICAANGSIVITCRGGRIALSPRRARPDDKCERPG